ncbi:MAG TPA: hypothetical protein VFJ07_22800 [Streptosporangiaceae bacterium]|nr:hypothetical protein [Streptosporangiaceae bacterium]
MAAEVIRPAAAAGGLDLEVSYPPSGLIVDGDADQLDRVLANLLSNAVKYTPGAGRSGRRWPARMTPRCSRWARARP